jgi:hypothetical protein
MKRVLCSILLAVVLSIFTISLVGCTSLGERVSVACLAVEEGLQAALIGDHGLGETPDERKADHMRQLRLNGSMMMDDIDVWNQQDRPSRLTEFTVR